MATLQDLMRIAMEDLGYSGSLNDMLWYWAGDNGGTSVQLNDRIYQALLENGATAGALPDLWMQMLTSEGFTEGSLQDRLMDFWAAGGSFYAFYAPLTTSLTEGKNTLSSFTTDVSDNKMTVTDFEGLVKNTVGDEARFVGARRVENLFADSLNLENFSVLPVACTVAFTGEHTDISFDALGYARHMDDVGAVNGNTYTISVEAKSSDVDPRFRFRFGTVGPTTSGDIVVTNEWVRYSATVTPVATSDGHVGVSNSAANQIARTIQFRNIQVEDVTGQTNQNPSEYVSVGVGTEAEENPSAGFDLWTDTTVPDGWTKEGTHNAANFVEQDSVDGLHFKSDGTLTGINIPIIIGRLYSYSMTVSHLYAAGSVKFWDASQIDFLSAVGTISGTFRATTTTLSLLRNGSADMRITELSVREINHGSNVDGVKYFDTENGNTVSSNVVTSATGSAITDATLKGVLIEELSTNLIHQSGSFASWWVGYGTPPAATHTEVGISGEVGAPTISDTDNINFEYWGSASIGVTANTTSHTLSFYVEKAASASNYLGVSFRYTNGGLNRHDFTVDHVNGAAQDRSIGGYSGTINVVSHDENWWRVTCVLPNDGTATFLQAQFFPAAAATYTGSWSATATGSITIDGIQVENLPYPTSYIPTAGSTVTRGASSLTYEPPAITDACCVVGEYYNSFEEAADQYKGFAILNDGTNNERLDFSYRTNSGGRLSVTDSTVVQADIWTVGAPYIAGFNKLGYSMETNNAKLFSNGVEVGIADTSCSVPNQFTQLCIGYRAPAPSGHINRPMKNVKIYDRHLTDAKMQELTS